MILMNGILYLGEKSMNQNDTKIYTKFPVISHFAKYPPVAYYNGTLVIVNENGTVDGCGISYYNAIEDARKWTDILTIVVVDKAIIGLKIDGTVVISGNVDGYRECLEWHNIISLRSNSYGSIIGITADGRICVKSKYRNHEKYQNEYQKIKDVICADISEDGILVLKKDGSVKYIGEDNELYMDAHPEYGIRAHTIVTKFSLLEKQWRKKQYTEVYFSGLRIIALDSDGVVTEYSYNEDYQQWIEKEVDHNWENRQPLEWKDVYHLYVNNHNLFAIKKDGTAIHGWNNYSSYEIGNWSTAFHLNRITLKNILSIFCCRNCFIGIAETGEIIWSGFDINGKLIPDNNAMPNEDDLIYTTFIHTNMYLFKDFNSVVNRINWLNQTMEDTRSAKEKDIEIQRRKEEEQRRIEEEKQRRERELLQSQYRSLGVCQHCGKKFKGLFTKICSSCGKPKDY